MQLLYNKVSALEEAVADFYFYAAAESVYVVNKITIKLLTHSMTTELHINVFNV